MTGSAASGPMSPRPSTAVPSVTMATVFPLIVSSWTVAGLVGDLHAHPGDAGRVRHRQVVAVGDRQVGEHLDLAALVHLEGAVVDSSTSMPVDAPDRVDHLCVGLGRAVDDDVLVEVVAPDVEALEPAMLPPTSPMAVARRPSMPGLLSMRTVRRTEKAAVGVATAPERTDRGGVRPSPRSADAGVRRTSPRGSA